MLSNFKKEKEKIIEAYNKLIEYKFVPLKEKNITENDIRDSIQELEEERFIVSFCGQIKAGKSTLLNALLFGEEILPAASTPHTAKVTIINYAEEPYFEVVYYSEKEWEDLKNTLLKESIEENGRKINYFDKYLKPQINQAITQGIYEDEVIGKPREKIKDLSKLSEFVGAKGKFMPFVKEIYLYYPNDILKQVTIVDTPGTNDPNPYRSKITEDWIHKSNAVVYVVYAGQAFSTVDIEFIDKYLVGIDPQLLVFAVNKMDMTDKLELEAWISKVKEDEKLKARRIMQDDDSIVYVSGLGGLIRKLCDAGKLENSKYAEDEEFLEKLDESGWIAEPGLEELERVIEEKIIRSKGSKILMSHKAKIKGILIDKILELKKDIQLLSENLKFYRLKKEELEKEIKTYEEKGKEFGVKQGELEDKRAEVISEFKSDLRKFFAEIEKKFLRDLKEKIGSLQTLDDIRKTTVAVVLNLLFEYNDKLFRELLGNTSPINRLILSLERELKNFEKQFRGKVIIAAGVKGEVYRTLSVKMEFLESRVKREVKKISEELSRLGVLGTIALWKRKEQLEDKKKSLLLQVEEEIIKPYFRSIYDDVVEVVNDRIESVINIIVKNIKDEISKILETLLEIQESAELNETKAQEIENQLNSLKAELKKYRNLAQEISDFVGVEIEEIC